MSKSKDPDILRVREKNGEVFIWWLYDEGPSGTLTLSNKAATDFALELEHAVLLNQAMEETNETGTDG